VQDKGRKKEDLVRELEALRKRIKKLERLEDDQRATESVLRTSAATLQGILRAAPIGIGIVTNRVLGWTNEHITKMLGYTQEELAGKSARILYNSDEEFQRVAFVKHPQVEKYGVGSLETNFRSKDGRLLDILLSSAAIEQGDMEKGLVFTAIDITERKKAEKELRESRKDWENIFQAIGHPAIVMDAGHRIINANNATARLTNLPPEDLRGRSCYEVFHGTDHPPDGCPMEALITSGSLEPVEMEMEVLGRFFIVYCTPVLDHAGKLTRIIHVATDITDHKRAELALQKSEERYRNIFENAVEGIFQSTPDGRILHVNPAMARFYGYETPLELTESITDIQSQLYVNPADRQRFKDHLERYGTIEQFESERYRKDGTTVWTSVNAHIVRGPDGETVYYEGTSIDISERKTAEKEKEKLQKQLFQAQKMEAIGVLAGGIAHDFNNMLMGIQGYASLMLLDTRQDHPHYEKLTSIEQQIQSGAELTRQLLGFARGGRYEVKPTDLNELVRRTSDMFGRTKREITIHRKLESELYPVDVDRGQVEQVLLNLYVNAWHAMPAGGEIYIESRNLIFVEGHSHHYSVAPGRYVKISVTDNGIGMDEETRQRIFEPFFTTKGMGRGTGLGLASVYGIIKNHGGIINVYSEKGKGTTFNIYLPASEKEVIQEKEVSGDILKGTETVLLVDDQETVLQVGEEMLRSLGYRVIPARSGKEAVAIYENNKETIDLVILDMIMPEMTGGETFEGLKTINDQVAVILSSGYSINGMAAKILKRGCKGFIQKPFNINELARKMREVLDAT